MEPQQIKKAARKHFKGFFTLDLVERPFLQNYDIKKVNHWLEAEFSEDEVWEVIRSCDGNRAPGPDGFTMAFFKQFWSVIKSTS